MQVPSSVNFPTTPQGENPTDSAAEEKPVHVQTSKNNFGFYDVFMRAEGPAKPEGAKSAKFKEETKLDWTGGGPEDSEESLGLGSQKKSFEPIVNPQVNSRIFGDGSDDEESRILI